METNLTKILIKISRRTDEKYVNKIPKNERIIKENRRIRR